MNFNKYFLGLMKLELHFKLLILLIFVLPLACKKNIKGDLKDNILPNTYTIVDTIIRTGTNRFPSQIKIQWWADDADGYITGYEYTFAKTINSNTVWHYIKGQDSTFTLTTPSGQDTANFVFWIRAIDNKNGKDASPASLTYPIKNTAPNIEFTSGVYNPTNVFPVLRLFWNATDADGNDNIDRLEIVWNDTTLPITTLANTVNSAIFQAISPSAATSKCYIYPNSISTKLDSTVANLKLNQTNVLYIRAIDKSNAKSHWKGSYTIYVKKISSPILLVDAYNGLSPMNYYTSRLKNNGHAVYDSMKIFESNAGNKTQQSDNETQAMIFKLFTHIIWFGDEIEKSLVTANKTTNSFFTNNGKMFMATKLQALFDEQSSYFGFSPASSIKSYTDTTLIFALDSVATPKISNWPVLKSTSFITPMKPFNLSAGAVSVYDAHLQAKELTPLATPPYPLFTGNSSVICKKNNPNNGQTNFILSQVELQNLDGNANADLLWNKILTELGL